MKITKKEVWVTPDGQEFDTEEQALSVLTQDIVDARLDRHTRNGTCHTLNLIDLLLDEEFCEAMYEWAKFKHIQKVMAKRNSERKEGKIYVQSRNQVIKELKR